MPRLAIANMFFGFLVLFLAAAAGAIFSQSVTDAMLFKPELLQSWQMTLQRSAHAHTNLFAMIHVLFGLTLPYSSFGPFSKKWQSFGLFCGTFAMGPMMIYRSFAPPTREVQYDIATLVTGFLLAIALFAIASHGVALWGKLISVHKP